MSLGWIHGLRRMRNMENTAQDYLGFALSMVLCTLRYLIIVMRIQWHLNWGFYLVFAKSDVDDQEKLYENNKLTNVW